MPTRSTGIQPLSFLIKALFRLLKCWKWGSWDGSLLSDWTMITLYVSTYHRTTSHQSSATWIVILFSRLCKKDRVKGSSKAPEDKQSFLVHFYILYEPPTPVVGEILVLISSISHDFQGSTNLSGAEFDSSTGLPGVDSPSTTKSPIRLQWQRFWHSSAEWPGPLVADSHHGLSYILWKKAVHNSQYTNMNTDPIETFHRQRLPETAHLFILGVHGCQPQSHVVLDHHSLGNGTKEGHCAVDDLFDLVFCVPLGHHSLNS